MNPALVKAKMPKKTGVPGVYAGLDEVFAPTSLDRISNLPSL